MAAITAALAATAAARTAGLAIGLTCMTSSRRRGRSPRPRAYRYRLKENRPVPECERLFMPWLRVGVWFRVRSDVWFGVWFSVWFGVWWQDRGHEEFGNLRC